MKERKKLTLQMTIFALIIFVSFGVIVVTEKAAPYFSPRIDNKLNNYLKNNYTSIINEFKVGNTNYKNTVYQLKITSSQNENLYFYLNYSNRKITDTYKEDYFEGRSLLTKVTNDLEKELEKKYNREFKVEMLNTLDKFSEQVKAKILVEDDISSLSIYSLETTIDTVWNIDALSVSLLEFHSMLEKDGIYPKEYIIVIRDSAKENKSIRIKGLTKKQFENTQLLVTIVSDILNGMNTITLKDNNITYEEM